MSTTWIFVFFLGLYLLFVWKAGKTYPLLYLFLLVYFIQYVFSVYLIYNEYPLLRREMVINQNQLFEYSIPALLFLFAGVFIFNRDVPIQHVVKRIASLEAARLGHILVVTSFAFEFLPLLGVPGMKSILSFTYYLRYAGAMCYLFAPSAVNYILLSLVYAGLLRDALAGGIFIDFLVWMSFLFLMISLRYRLSFRVRFSFIMLAIPAIILIQSIKKEYRDLTWSGRREGGIGLLSEIAQEKQMKEDDPFESSDGVIRTLGRLNQGWHLGMVLKRVPTKEPFSYGDDLLSDLQGVILPRLLVPEKKVIGSQDKFRKFTGHRLHGRTSMTIGILGDFYVNFGWWGSFIALFIFGAIMARLLYWFIQRYVMSDPINIVWVPFLFSYLVRANNDFYIVANNLFKGFLIFLIISFIRHQIWPVRHSVQRK